MRLLSPRAVACLTLAIVLATTGGVRAQEPDVPSLGQPVVFVPGVARARGVAMIGARRPDAVLTILAATDNVQEPSLAAAGATLAGQSQQGSLATLPMLVAGNRLGLVPLPEQPEPFEPDQHQPIEKAEPLLAHLIQGVRDDKPFAKNWYEDEDEQFAFSKVLYVASGISAEAFRKGARKDLTYVHVFNQPSKYRGQVVHVEGTLRQLWRLDPPLTAKAAGVANMYEGWISDPRRFGANPWCVVFTDLPSGIAPGEDLHYPVSFDGYFFKRYRYALDGTSKVTKPKDWPRVPMLIGRTVTLTGPPAAGDAPDFDWAGSLLPIFLGIVACSIAVAFVLGYLFRRADRKVQQRIAAIAQQEFVEPNSNDEVGTMNDVQDIIHRSSF